MNAAAPSLEQRAAALGLGLRPLHAKLGVEVTGLDLSLPLSAEQAALVVDAWRAHDLVLFRRQQCMVPADEERVMRLLPHCARSIDSRQFCSAFFKERIPANPLVVVRGHNIILKDHYGITMEEPLSVKPPYIGPNSFKLTRIWHQDMGDQPSLPEAGSMLMLRVPRRGGETIFASTRLDRLQLDGELTALLRRLHSVNCRASLATGFGMDSAGLRRVDDLDAKVAACKAEGGQAQALMPLVATDPDTGAESLVASAHTFVTFDGMPPAKSRELLQGVLERVVAPANIYMHAWQEGDFMVWANRRTVHTGTAEEAYADDQRLLHLIFLDSARPLPALEAQRSLGSTFSMQRTASRVLRTVLRAASFKSQGSARMDAADSDPAGHGHL